MGTESVNGGTYTFMFFCWKTLFNDSIVNVNVINSNTRVPFLRFTSLEGGTKWAKVLACAGSISHLVYVLLHISHNSDMKYFCYCAMLVSFSNLPISKV